MWKDIITKILQKGSSDKQTFWIQVIAENGAHHGKSDPAKSSIPKLPKTLEPAEIPKPEIKPEIPKPNPPVVSKEFTDLFGSPLIKQDITRKASSKPTAYASLKVSLYYGPCD